MVMTNNERPPFPGRAVLYGVGLGLAYGIGARLLYEWTGQFAGLSDSGTGQTAFLIMTAGFIIGVPIVIGYLTVVIVEAPSGLYAFFTPWLTCLLCIAASFVTGLEGAICVIFASPIMLLASSIGGFVARNRRTRSRGAFVALLLLPPSVVGIETTLPLPDRLVTSVVEVSVDAPASVVWPLVVSVDTIRPAERRRALFTSIGFPAPIAATLDRPGVGGVRTATFERGVRFHEVVTHWEPERRLSFSIGVTAIPSGALDDHVTIGGPFFDVLDGTYELIALDSSRTLVRLTSTHRVSTHFNPYAAWWAERVMVSIQVSILDVLRARALAGVSGRGTT